MNIKRKSKGTPEQMLQAFENKINELEGTGCIESATKIASSNDAISTKLTYDFVEYHDDASNYQLHPERFEKVYEILDQYTEPEDEDDVRWAFSRAPIDVQLEILDIISGGEFKADIEEWTPEFKECYNDGITSSTDSVRQQDYNTLVAQGMSPEEAWAEIENYEYAEDYDDIDAATDIKAADEETDAEYLEKLCEYVTVNLDDAGYEATAYIKDGYLVIESMYDSNSQFIQDIEEIEPNWDDLDGDAQELSDAYIEKYPDPTYSQSEDDEY